MGWLAGDVALITGGGSGLGRALVDRFLAEGARVGVLEHSLERAAQLEADLGQAVVVTRGDVRSLDDNRAAVAATVERFGRLDAFVGNAGIQDAPIALEDLSDEQLERGVEEVFGVNVKGYIFGARAAVAELLSTGGSMVFTSSSACAFAGGGGILYT